LHSFYPQIQLVSFLCLRDEAAFLWKVTYHCWTMITCRCVLWIHCSWVFIAMCWTVTSWSGLEVTYSIDKSMCKQTLTRWHKS
jgi:hypothetical protein